jgi:O-antigen ligase
MYQFLLVVILYLPFQLAINPWAGVDLASIRVLILILFFWWLARGLKNKRIEFSCNIQTVLIISFLSINFLSIVIARNSDWSARKLLFLFSIFPVYFVASKLIINRKRLLEVISAIVFSAALAASIGIVQFVSQFAFGFKSVYSFWANFIIIPFLGSSFGEAVLKNPSWLVNISGKTYLRATSVFPDPHMFSFYLGLALPLACGMFLYEKKRKPLFLLAALAIFLADIFTFSRGGYLGLFSGFIFVSVFFWNKIQKKYKIATGIFLGLVFLVMLIPSPISQRFLSSFDTKEGSNKGRIVMWEKAIEIVIDNPVLGVGIGNYPLEVSAVSKYRDPIYAHNTYLDIAAETGIANAFVWILLIVSSAIVFWKKSAKEPVLFFAVISILVFATHSLVETAIYSPVVLTLFLLIISLSQIKIKNEKNI